MARYVRSVSFYIYFSLFAAFGFLFLMASAGGLAFANVDFGDGGKVLSNSPYALGESISAISFFGILVVAAIAGKAAFIDFQHRTHSFFFTSPIRKIDYLGGRFLAAMFALAIIHAGIACGILAATWMPGLDHARMGPNHLLWYVQPYLSIVFPNVFVTGALFFALAALSRRIAPVYAASVILLVGYMIASAIEGDIHNRFLAAMLDPFGGTAADQVSQYWTVSEKNTRVVGWSGPLAWNRLAWMGVGAAVLAFAYARFKFEYQKNPRRTRKKQRAEMEGVSGTFLLPAAQVFSTATYVRATIRLALRDFVAIVKSVPFALIVLGGVGFMVVAATVMGRAFGTLTYPVTYQVLDSVGGSFSLFVLILITFFSGELVWRDRDAGVNELTDTMPLPDWVLFLHRLLALFLVQVLLMAVVTVTGIAFQLSRGYTRIEFGQYLVTLFGLHLFDYCLVAVIAITVQTLVNNKYAGHGVMVLYYAAGAFMGRFGLERMQYNYGKRPSVMYSDMNGYGPFLGPAFWFDAYWAACAVMLAVVAHLFWVRGLAVDRRSRVRLARHRFNTRPKALAIVAAVAFVSLGAFIYYNTSVLHHFRTSHQSELIQVHAERDYKKYAALPQPRITGVQCNVDLFPRTGAVRIHGRYTIANKTGQPVERVFVVSPETTVIHKMQFAPAAKLEFEDRPTDVLMYRLERPLAPGAEGTLDFDLENAPHGFSNSGASTLVVSNGTFLNSGLLPHFGYEERAELSDDNMRRRYGLSPKPRVADIHDERARRNTYISTDADWVDFDAVVSTVPDQIAIAPGELVREWTEGGRRYFEYRSRGKILNFFSVLSGRYQVVKDRWRDVDLAIYYQRGHEYNLAKMMKGMKTALEYCTVNFSPYQNKTLRIVEFPRYESFAQSFPASVPFSEAIGFIAHVDPADEKDLDYPFYVTAHEVAHQWWAHQVIGANVQGATMLSESLAEYTALMVMHHEYGAGHMKRFLKYDMDHYLQGRAAERQKELPLVRNEGQGYIYYQKGSVVFYALQDYLGEAKLNAVLRDYLRAMAFQGPPYTTALELEERLRAAAPPDLRYLITDMIDSIVLYENRAVSATSRKLPGGDYEVKLKVAARKVKAGELGVEKEMPLADWIDIGVFDAKERPLYFQKHKIEKAETEFTLDVKGVPAKAGIDPWNRLIDRIPDDNVIDVQVKN